MTYPILLSHIGGELAEAIDNELMASFRHGKTFATLHEAYAVILEELDEIWDVTRQKKRDRDAEALRKELIQLAAMAIKAVKSMENFVGGNV